MMEEAVHVKSYISFNRGGRWEKLSAPEVSARGKPLRCHEEKGCSLHLHSYSTTTLPAPYSTESAVGLIMGIGNLGQELSFRDEELSTYLSRDGGMTWSEVRKGAYVMEFGDHGALIVMAPLFKPTRELFFTWDEGKTWDTMIISDSMVNVDNIIAEPKSISLNFVIHGHYDNTESDKGLIISVDFAQQGVRACSGADDPNSSTSDYEKWTPYDGRQGTDKCFLGKKQDYVRRKQSSVCVNGQDHEHIIFRDDCACTEMDFECDIGYRRASSGLCEPTKELPPVEAPQTCSGYYEITQGYRKVPGNTCYGGELFHPIKVSCPGSWNLISFKTILVILLIVGLFFVAKPYLNEDYLEKLLGLVKSSPKKDDREGYKSDFSSGGNLNLEDDEEDEEGAI